MESHSKFYYFMRKITLLMDGGMYLIEMSVISTIQGAITMQFRTAPTSLVGMVVSITGLFMLPTTLLGGKLCQYISKKTLLVVGCVIYTLSGLSICWMNDLGTIIAMRALMGIGIGLVSPVIPSLIVKYYDGKERNSMFGLGMTVSCVIGVAFALLCGVVAAKNWHYANYLFLFGVIMTVCAIVFIPPQEPERVDYTNAVKTQGKLPPFGMGILVVSVIYFCVMVLNGVYSIKMGVLVLSERMGSIASIGMLMAVYQIGALLFGMAFSKMFTIMYRYLIVFGIAIYGLGFFLMGSAHTLAMVGAGVFFIGWGMVFMGAYAKARVAEIVPKVRMSVAMAIIGSVGFVAQFCSSLWAQLLENIAGNNNPRTSIIGTGYGYVVLAVICLVVVIATRKSKALNTDERFKKTEQIKT